MKIDRRVVARKDQLLVPVPAKVRDHLGLVGSARVWWHIGRKGLASLTTSGRLLSGRPRREEDCPACAKYRDELERYRRELREREAATPGQYWRQGYMRAVGDLGNVKHDLDLALTMLKQLLADSRRAQPQPLAPRRRVRGRRVETVAAPVLDAPSTPTHDAGGLEPESPRLGPSDLPSELVGAVVRGGADTSGAEPPGVPLET